MSFNNNGNDVAENVDCIENTFNTSDLQNLSELTLNASDMETEDQEIVVENQEIIGHEEEVEMEEVVTEELEIILDGKNKCDSETINMKPNKSVVAPPPLRPLTIAPKPTKVPLAVKSVGGQPLLFLQGAGTGQAIKLVSPQGQELNIANLMTRPLTTFKTMNSVPVGSNNISLVQQKPLLMKKVPTTLNQKTITKPLTNLPKQQHFMVVQKADNQQQLKLIQSAPKTLTFQQAQEMGLIAKPIGGKQTVLINKNLSKSIKVFPQSGVNQVQTKSPTKILPASNNSGLSNKSNQRIIFKSASVPQGQILQLSSTQNLNSGQLHQINIPGKGVQYIKFITSESNTTTSGNVIKSTSSTINNSIVLSEVKPITTLKKIVPKDKVPISPNKCSPLVMIPTQVPSVPAVQPVKIAIPPTVPKSNVTLKSSQSTGGVAAAAASSSLPSLPNESASNTTQSQDDVDANGMRPRKPCNCNKSQCLKLYCDCFANGEFCYMCNCMNCNNNLENEEHRNRAIKACLERNPHAFRPKIGKAKDVAGDISIRKHTKGCNCKRSGCLKNYCECYENKYHSPLHPTNPFLSPVYRNLLTCIAKIACSNNCKCIGCRNIEDSIEKKNIRQVTEKATNTPIFSEMVNANIKNHSHQMRPRRSSNIRKQTINFITDDVIEATCQCLLTISDNADENMQDEELTKRLIIEEFGRCLTEIIDCSSSRNLS